MSSSDNIQGKRIQIVCPNCGSTAEFITDKRDSFLSLFIIITRWAISCPMCKLEVEGLFRFHERLINFIGPIVLPIFIFLVLFEVIEFLGMENLNLLIVFIICLTIYLGWRFPNDYLKVLSRRKINSLKNL